MRGWLLVCAPTYVMNAGNSFFFIFIALKLLRLLNYLQDTKFGKNFVFSCNISAYVRQLIVYTV